MVNDLLCNMENGEATLLVAVDLSGALDTVDHGVQQHVLHARFGISESALEWFHSYLSQRGIFVYELMILCPTLLKFYSRSPKDLWPGLSLSSIC